MTPHAPKRPVLVTLMSSAAAVVGTVLTTVSALLFLVLFAIQQVGFAGGAYLGIVSFLLLPAVFALGLVLIPLGIWRARVRERKHLAAGAPPPSAPVIDFNRPRTRNIALVLVAFSCLNVVILSVGTYKGVQVMESTQFCGGACHSVMSPEYTAYQQSPHARVACTECHVGSGADSFVASKVSGARRLVALVFNRYRRPIPTPVHGMRPAEQTCQQCHAPNRFTGERLVIHSHFSPDEKQTEKKTVVLLRIGGLQNGKWEGIHAHVGRQIRFRADQSRAHIYEVELRENGKTTVFQPTVPAGSGAAGWRAMDCTDCHNRPAHTYRMPNDELDAALESKALDRSLPFIKREGLNGLQARYASQADAHAGLRSGLLAFYQAQYPTLVQSDAKRIDAAAEELWDIYRRNVFPEMGIGWGTYPTFAGHDGCFRCHDNEHVTSGGEKISKKCELCHQALATDEVDPEILQVLHP